MSLYTLPIEESAHVRLPNSTKRILFDDCMLGCDPDKLQHLKEAIAPYRCESDQHGRVVLFSVLACQPSLKRFSQCAVL
jgi:hypothetical protein